MKKLVKYKYHIPSIQILGDSGIAALEGTDRELAFAEKRVRKDFEDVDCDDVLSHILLEDFLVENCSGNVVLLDGFTKGAYREDDYSGFLAAIKKKLGEDNDHDLILLLCNRDYKQYTSPCFERERIPLIELGDLYESQQSNDVDVWDDASIRYLQFVDHFNRIITYHERENT